jgi:asparagine synthase (glutamine-hydrolysing)
MCGIAGILHFDQSPVAQNEIRAMADIIRHRGPDGEGFYTRGPVGLGHRRLSIIDLSLAGRQPMISNNERFVMVYNGEVYNFKELRLELEDLGHRFKSHTDSEVVLEAYSAWGVKALDRLNGMFAFAIWDQRDQSLFLARDRFGVKPLYYSITDKNFLFGSEIKAIAEHPSFQAKMNLEALFEYFTFQNIFTDQSLFEGVRLLMPGSFLKVDLQKSKVQGPVTYWDYSFSEPEKPLSEMEYIEELDRLFRQAVKRQLVSDVDLGSYLSGGMDSGSITAVAAKSLPYMKTFTTGFDLSSASGIELAFDERQKAEAMSYLFKTEHYEMVLKSGDMERIMPRLVWHLEDLRVGQSYPNFYVAQLASKFVKVVLSGTGGDELFGGYPWRYYQLLANQNFSHYIDKYYGYWQRLLQENEMSSVFSPVWSQVKNVSTRDIFKNVFHKHADQLTRPEDYIHHSLYFEAKTFLHGLLLVEDKLSLAHGLETRVPFLDNDLVEFAMKLPARLKLGNLDAAAKVNENELGKIKQSLSRTSDGKQILRKMMNRHIPREVTQREKQGFSAPDASWFRGESMEYVKRKLFNPSSPIYDFLDRSSVQNLLMQHLEGKQNKRLLIWSLLCVNEWCEQFLGVQSKDARSFSSPRHLDLWSVRDQEVCQ